LTCSYYFSIFLGKGYGGDSIFWLISIVSSFFSAIGEMKFPGDPKLNGSMLCLGWEATSKLKEFWFYSVASSDLISTRQKASHKNSLIRVKSGFEWGSSY
jgi:hypothetical protein